jgi:hypothetical protein
VAQLFSLGSMDATLKMQEQSVAKRSLPVQLIALFIFLLIGGIFSWFMVLAEDGGEASGGFKSLVVILVFCRLAWQVYRRTFRFRDYFIYFAVVIGFCFLIDDELGYILSK